MIRGGVAAALLGAVAVSGACGDAGPGARPATQAPPPAEHSAAAGAATPTPGGRFHFTDTAAQAGVTATTWCGRPEKPHLLESGGNGLALFDADGDGDLDLYVVSGWRLDGADVVERTPNALYRNRGDGTFDDVTAPSGAGDTGWGTGVAVGDFDGDGHPDLFVTNFGPDVLLRNRGDGTFERVADPPGIDGWSAAAVFFDADRDGDEDLFVCGYVDCTLDDVLAAQPSLDWKSHKVMMGPFGLEGLANRAFRNEGGRFVEATDALGLGDAGEYFSFGAAACDFDGDFDLDLYVANDSNPNYLYRNDGSGVFEEIGLWCGAGLSGPGAAQAGMGVGVGDFDGDLAPDIVVTNFAEDVTTLYRNTGRLLFRDATLAAGLREPTFEPLSWGVVFSDLDLDGDEELVIANGHIYPQADRPGTRATFRQRNLLLDNAGGRFRDATSDAGPGFAVVASSRGLAAGDLDGDGDVDLVVSNVDAPPTLLRNDSPRAGAWLLVDAPQALRVQAESGGRAQVRHRVRGGSFCSESDPRFHFGLPGAPPAVRLTLTWPDGRETVVAEQPVNRVVRFAAPK